MIKNPSTYWGLGASLLGHHANRVVAASGTPYNNRIDDLAHIFSFIYAGSPLASVAWWKDVVSEGMTTQQTNAECKGFFEHPDGSPSSLIRRQKSILSTALPGKITDERLMVAKEGLGVYIAMESALIDVLQNFAMLVEDADNQFKRKQRDELFQIMIALMQVKRE